MLHNATRENETPMSTKSFIYVHGKHLHLQFNQLQHFKSLAHSAASYELIAHAQTVVQGCVKTGQAVSRKGCFLYYSTNRVLSGESPWTSWDQF